MKGKRTVIALFKSSMIRLVVALMPVQIVLLVSTCRLHAQALFGRDEREHVCGVHQAHAPDALRRAEENTRRFYPGLDGWLQQSLGKATSPVLGTEEVFWTYNFSANRYDTVRAELRATGTLSYVWVALSELANSHVTQIEVNAILDALENRTPRSSQDSSQGILRLARRFFGEPPNINSNFVKGAGDGKTHFLIYDIVDGFDGSGSFVGGYFHSKDVNPGTFSNRRDMLYIDSYPTIFFNNRRDPSAPLGLLAHEFQHLIQWNYDPAEIVFFNEGLSELSTYLVGYGLRSPGRYLSNPNVALLGWSSSNDQRVLADYSRAALMLYYLWDRYGEPFIRNLAQQPLSGVEGFNAAAVQTGLSTNLVAAVKDFQVANYVQDRSVGLAYGYGVMPEGMGRPRLQRDNFGPVSSGTRSGVEPLGVEYMRLRVIDSLRAFINITSGSADVQVVRTSSGGTTVSAFPPDALYQTTFVGSPTSEVVFLIHNSRTSSSLVSYSYTTTGAIKANGVLELAHDDRRTQRSPTTALGTNDTIHVAFEGVAKSKLDSVAMWFQSTGSASLMIRDWNSNYDISFQPRSGLSGRARLVAPVAFTVTDTGYMKTVVDLRSRTVGSNTDFLVQVIYGFSAPHPLLRRDSAQSVLHSYLSIRSEPTPGRVIYQSAGDFYVRAYLSFNEQEIDEPPPVITSLELRQNYPNPFYPRSGQATTLQYSLPRDAHVRLELFDLLGHRVKLLEDRSRFADRYRVEWDGTNDDGYPVASGVYLVRLHAGGMMRATKIILVR